MLDNNSINRSTNNYNYSVNAVSGTIRKSHPKSKITIEPLVSTNRIWDDLKPVKDTKVGAGSRWEEDYKQVVILQTMLMGENRAMVEWVFLTDFIETEVPK